MTRLGFLLGEGLPGTARIPMDDKIEKKVFNFLPPLPTRCLSQQQLSPLLQRTDREIAEREREMRGGGSCDSVTEEWIFFVAA